ncbi:hypothetical protein [Pseudooctadecabacter jejudonensis]|uniref:Uncharacterized protein n=1 Tax=Pseudooctadecabacter jejudonensis TaxID=1391910 RepID=A0A1Y5RQH4_9RHOB|nr:hypothetical protein [Pseudooctadecabacter jejudonensis]SLN22998.1 hypothetical protein PSJ8397_00958 [Pseudooctadecabacter jejudonensis]
MARFIIFLAVLAAVIAVITAVRRAWRTALTHAEDPNLPKSMQTLTYILLLLLMLGVVTGWLEGL